eukprot:m.359913 g.359913  ORF g.359913 m.359913 type:complete len:137 (+) comp20766_c1_seq3:1545-1955(+)
MSKDAVNNAKLSHRVPSLENSPSYGTSVGVLVSRWCSVARAEDRGNPMVAYSWGTSDAGAFEVRTVQRMTPPPHEQWGSPITVNVTSVNGPTGGIEGGSSLGLVCCDAHGLPVLAYTRRLSMYESYLAFATMQVIS